MAFVCEEKIEYSIIRPKCQGKRFEISDESIDFQAQKA